MISSSERWWVDRFAFGYVLGSMVGTIIYRVDLNETDEKYNTRKYTCETR